MWLDTVRIARDFGDIAQLLPRGIRDLRDCPYPLYGAIKSAMLYLSFDELPKDERPPRRIWDDGRQLEAWFEDVERKRNSQARGDKQIEGEAVDNAAAEELLSG